jgi:REP element-mobilizing transposase RayT
VLKKFPDTKEALWRCNFWSDGYFVATVGEHDVSAMEEYIKI